jgi:hypothetical protein
LSTTFKTQKILKLGEIVKPIEGYSGEYWVSNLGRIFSQKYNDIRELKNALVHGYPSVSLCQNCRAKKFQIHRLVAEAFISNPQSLKSVDHIDNNRFNNNVNNLQWLSLEDNTTK